MPPPPVPWHIIILISIPQTYLIIKIGLHLFNLHISNLRTLTLTLPASILVILVRELPLPFGIHTIILIIATALLTAVVAKINWRHILIAITAGTLIVGVLEGALLPMFLNITAANPKSLAMHPWLNIVYFLPLVMIIILFYSIIKKNQFTIFDFSLDKD